jgi:hypothetical protein
MTVGEIATRDIARIEGQIIALTKEYREGHSDLVRQMTEVKTLVAQHPTACPYRERIAMIAENTKDIEDVRQDVNDLKRCVRDIERAVDRSSTVGGVAGGGVVSIVAGIIFGVGKAAGWW